MFLIYFLLIKNNLFVNVLLQCISFELSVQTAMFADNEMLVYEMIQFHH